MFRDHLGVVDPEAHAGHAVLEELLEVVRVRLRVPPTFTAAGVLEEPDDRQGERTFEGRVRRELLQACADVRPCLREFRGIEEAGLPVLDRDPVLLVSARRSPGRGRGPAMGWGLLRSREGEGVNWKHLPSSSLEEVYLLLPFRKKVSYGHLLLPFWKVSFRRHFPFWKKKVA